MFCLIKMIKQNLTISPQINEKQDSVQTKTSWQNIFSKLCKLYQDFHAWTGLIIKKCYHDDISMAVMRNVVGEVLQGPNQPSISTIKLISPYLAPEASHYLPCKIWTFKNVRHSKICHRQ